MESEREKVHMAVINFVELYIPRFSGATTAEGFYSRVMGCLLAKVTPRKRWALLTGGFPA